MKKTSSKKPGLLHLSLVTLTCLMIGMVLPSCNQKEKPVSGQRFFTLATVVRVNQIETSRNEAHGEDESAIHSAKEARIFRETIARVWPGARITWAFSWLALQDQRQNYQEIRDLVVEYHHTYGDEITFIPGGYFANMYNSREQVNQDLHEGLQMVSDMVGKGYRPKAVIAGFLSAENLRYLAEEEGIHVCQGSIWSQYAIDNGDGEGSVSYPYYPSLEHFCKPAQNEDDLIDCVNLDGWTMDFLNAIYPGGRMIDGEWCGSRQGVGPIETVIRLGTKRGTKEMLHVTSAHFDQGFELNDFGWITCTWELGLVEGRKIYGYQGRNGMEGMEIWLSEMQRRWPDAQMITHGEFGMKWREEFKNNDDLNYQFVQRGSGICGSDPDQEIRWFMNKDFRMALLRDWRNHGPEKLIDFTRYDLPASEPNDPEPGEHTRNWSLMNRLNQKGVRPEDVPMNMRDLEQHEKELIRRWYPGLMEQDPNLHELSDGFTHPDKAYRPGAFWCWLNGDITPEAISRDLREMSEKGLGRAEIWDVAAINNPEQDIPAGPAFLSDSSVALIHHALREGERYGIEIGMIGSSGWNAGGTWVEPDWASKQLFFSETDLQGPYEGTIQLPFPETPAASPKKADGRPVFSLEVAALAIRSNQQKTVRSVDEVRILPGDITDDQLLVSLPAGNWKILRFICSNNGQQLIVPSPKSKGLFIDFLDPEATVKHLAHILDRLGITGQKKQAGGLAYIEFDSMELAEGIPWTDEMSDIFQSLRGYDLTPWLAVLAGWKIGQETDRFLYDWKKAISDQLIFSHYISGREFLKTFGIDLVAEAGGPGPPVWSTCPVDALKALGNVSVPRGEFWVQHRNIFLVKQIASASHIYDLDVVDAESFTTWRRWKDSPFDLKKLVDRAFCEGLNNVTFHTFASSSPEHGLPGRTYHAGCDVNLTNTWWNKARPFMDYLTRTSYMLQQGLFVADACYYYGDQAPNFFPAHHWVPEKIIPEDLGYGYDFDVVNSDVILHRMTVENGKITLPDGLSYHVLVLPNQDHMPLDVLQKLEHLVREGATIIGPKPRTIPYLPKQAEEQDTFNSLTRKLWPQTGKGSDLMHAYGKGRVITSLSPREVLIHDGIEPDFICPDPSVVDYIHRASAENDWYFIRNKSDKPWSGICSFRIDSRYAEVWDPATGQQTHLADASEQARRTALSLDLAPGGSVFVVFGESKRTLPPGYPDWQDAAVLLELNTDWRLTFPENWGAPAEMALDKLISWTDSEVDGVKYFSGTATYHKSFELSKEDVNRAAVGIDLGEVGDVAEVFVNGQSAGILWKPPFTLDISTLVRAGKNELKIEVVNQWVNRLTGDMLADPEDRYCQTNQPYITSDDFGIDNWAAGGDETFRVKPSGLLGQVRILQKN